MAEHPDPYILACPACGNEFIVDEADDLCHTNDTEDNCTTPCPGCGAALVVDARCEVFFSTTEEGKTDG